MATTRMLRFFTFLVLSGVLTSENAMALPMNVQSNDRPIIAILSQKISPDLLPPGLKGTSYIAASYIKYIESAGARVVPVTTTMTKDEVEEIFYSVNGVLYPGGGATLFASPYFTNAEIFYNLASKANMQGDFFPIWGTCLGFQALTSLTAGNPVVSHSNAIDITIPLNFTSEAPSSRMLTEASKELMEKLSTEGLTYNFHYNCVTPETFSKKPKLKDTYRVLSYNNDVNGKTFVSTIEGKSSRKFKPSLSFFKPFWIHKRREKGRGGTLELRPLPVLRTIKLKGGIS